MNHRKKTFADTGNEDMMMKNLVILSLIFFSTALTQTNNEAFKLETLEHMRFERYGEAIELLNKYISSNPQKTDGYNLRAVCYEKRGLYEQAVYDLRTAKKINPTDTGIQESLERVTGTWYVLLKNNIAGYKREIAINPALPHNYLEIGKAYKNMGEWTIAEEWYDRYLTMEEASPDEILRYTEILSALNKISKCEPILKKFTEKYPDDHRLWSRYGYFTLWLGKNKIAIAAFENSLELRPYFKEAMDGLGQAKGEGYVYTFNDSSHKNYYGTQSYGYAIDRYFSKLKSNPNDNTTRLLLINELIKTKRFDEAQKEIEKLADVPNYRDDYLRLLSELKLQKQKYYLEIIADLENKFLKNPGDEKLLLQLTDAFINIGDYESAKKYYEEFLRQYPGADNVRYKFALHSGWFKDFCSTKNQLSALMAREPHNRQYLLLKLKYALWADEIEPELSSVIDELDVNSKNDFEFYTIAASILIRLDKTDKAQLFIEEAEKLNPSSLLLVELKNALQMQKNNSENQKLFAMLEEARLAAYHKNCRKSIELYNKYLAQKPEENNVQRELANAYLCDENYKQAITIYDAILLKEYNFSDALQRAKLFLWSGDSLNALREFKKLNSLNPDDNEVKLLLGDAYLAAGLENIARLVYSDLLAQFPESYIINKRLKWLSPDQYSSGASDFPTYVMIVPEANLFRDNISLRYNTQGLGLQLGVTNYLAAGISFYRGNLSSDSGDTDFNILKGNIFLKLNKMVSATAGFGRSRFNNSVNSSITEVSVKAEKESKYFVLASFNASDAAHIMYSPFLVNERLDAKNYSLTGKYFATTSTFLSGRFLYNSLSDSNDGYHLDLKLGENFNNKISAGYEYSYIDYANRSTLYWTPENFESHSVWADWNFIKNDRTSLTIGGKVGLIPANDFILREISGSVSHKFFNKLTLQGKAIAGSTVKQETGYSSTSVSLTIFWTF